MAHKLRLASGLVILSFVVLHFSNHVAAIVSLQAAESTRALFHGLWGNAVGGLALYGALIVHFVLALKSLLARRTLRLPFWELAQLALGLIFIPLIAAHAVATRGAEEILSVPPEYARTVFFIWADNVEISKQSVLIVITWAHAALGLHFWLRLKPWYAQASHLLSAFYLLFPVLVLIGFYRAGKDSEVEMTGGELALSMARLGVGPEEYATFVANGERWVWVVSGVCLGSVLLVRFVRRIVAERKATFLVEHPNATNVRGTIGQSLLETLRANGIPHASVCGGRGRCTTCRVRIGTGLEHLEDPSPTEKAALDRIGAEPTVRLACQTHPLSHVSVTPLVPLGSARLHATAKGGVQGTERVITVLFVDLRGSTKLGQARLPYDVLFVLNQFFSEMASSLRETEGHYAQFNGDGLMAIYGRTGSTAAGARAALQGAAAMLRRLENLNRRLGRELSEPLRVGIGVHTGEAIVGTMGPPESPIYSAIGDNVNVAARLEALTKELSCLIVVSAETAKQAELPTDALRREDVSIRGRSGTFSVYALNDVAELGVQAGPGKAVLRAG